MKSQLRAADSAKLRAARSRGDDPPSAHARATPQVRAVAAEALRAEIVGHAAALDVAQPLRDRLGISGNVADRDAEPVGAVRPGAQLAAMRRRLEHAEALAFEPGPATGGRAGRLGQAVVLPRHRVAILVTAQTHVARGDLRRAGQRGGDPARVRAALLDVEQQVRARPVGREAKQLLDAEVLGHRAYPTPRRRRTPGERELVHLSRRSLRRPRA